MGLTKPIEQLLIKLLRYIYVSKRYYTREKNIMSIICRYVPMTERFWEWLLPENGRA